MSSALAQIILLICPLCLFIQFSYFLVDNLVRTSGKAQGLELCLDISAIRLVILGYKCVHEGYQKSFKSRKGWNIHRQRNCGIQVWRQVILRWAAVAEHPKLHLQPIVDASHQDAHRPDLLKQELQTDLWKQELLINANIKEKCSLYLQNIVHFTAKTPHESTAKNMQKA